VTEKFVPKPKDQPKPTQKPEQKPSSKNKIPPPPKSQTDPKVLTTDRLEKKDSKKRPFDSEKDTFRRKAQDNLLKERGRGFKGEKHKCKNGSYGQARIDPNRTMSKKIN
jgi:hypothetical protein